MWWVERGLRVSRRGIIFYNLFGVGNWTKPCPLVGVADCGVVSGEVVGRVDEAKEDQHN